MQAEEKTVEGGQGIVRQIRRSLGMTQGAVAKTLGVSIRAIQSYEQGWRKVPTPVVVQLLILAAAHRLSALDGKPCWEVTGCPPHRRNKCPSSKTDGRLCWFVSGRMCGDESPDKGGDLGPCLECPVVQQLLS